MHRMLYLVLVTLVAPTANLNGDQAQSILDAAAVRGGLIVHLNCGDGGLTAALGADSRYLVHGLSPDPDAVAGARRRIQSLGLYGRVSVEAWSGPKLPYAANLVNLVVAEELGNTTRAECLRVLAPQGVLMVKVGEGWEKTVKPRPPEIDEWTHHLHDAGGNPVGRDSVVGPPRHLQWTDGPLWARSHGWTPSVTAMVSSGGRLFTIGDETLNGAGDAIPSKWFLVARDAFNGVVLWKLPVPDWGSQAYSGTPDSGGGISVGRFTMPTHAGKRMVAVGDTVYVTLGAAAPVSALDAATGTVRRVYAETERTDEILYSDGRLILAINPPDEARQPLVEKDETPSPADGKRVCAVDAETGRMLWQAGPYSAPRAGRGQDPFGRLELAATQAGVFLLTSATIECLDPETGDRRWQIDRPDLPDDAVRKLGFSGMYEYLLAVMVVHDDVVLLAQPEPNTHHTYHTMPGTLYAFAADDGRRLWQHGYGGWGHCTPPDVFVIGDQVWTHVDAATEFGSVWGNGFRAADTSVVDYRIQALDLRTGETRREISTRDLFNVGHHHRCYRNKITEHYLMSSRRGVEFVDLQSGENFQNHWVRSGCKLGNLPCNGLLYVTPHPCGCYLNAKLTGFNALAAALPTDAADEAQRPESDADSSEDRLARGPAFADPARDDGTAQESASDWPTYRHDILRSGATESAIHPDGEIAWQTSIGGRPSPPVIAGGKIYVAAVDAHTLHVLDLDQGTPAWSFTAGARIPIPPTLHRGRAIFGGADGRVVCLRAADGKLCWRFQAAPEEQRIIAFGQLESAWPVPGVLVHDDACWFAAGRSSYLDGGILVTAVDPITGAVLHTQRLYSPDPASGKMPPEPAAQTMPGVLNDIPVSDGQHVFLRQLNLETGEEGGGKHLFTTAGFLDSTWFNRTYWKIGAAQTTGPMVLGEGVAFGLEPFTSRSRDVLFQPGQHAHRLRCLSIRSPVRNKEVRRAAGGPAAGMPDRSGMLWEQTLAIRPTAMIRAAETLFVGGVPDVVDPEDPHAAWEGRKGGVLAAFSAVDGSPIAEFLLPAPPVWDGMSAADGRLILSLSDGTVVCLGGR